MDEKISRLVEVAKLYYRLDYSQQEIAKRLGISRPHRLEALSSSGPAGGCHNQNM